MVRTACGAVLIALLAAAPAVADTRRDDAQTTERSAKSSSTRKRVIWTVVGAGAGFAAGVYLGFNKFDDATYAERKIWTTSIIGAAAGGVTGALLSRNVSRSVPLTEVSRATVVPDLSWGEAVRGPSPTSVFKR
jgi:hypothetical protein